MTWLEYVLRIAGDDGPKAMATRTGLDGPHMSKWKAGTVPGPSIVAQFARGYGRPVLEAFVAAEFLTAEEAGERPSAAPNFTQLTNDELLELVRTRMREDVMGNAEHPAANTDPASGSGGLSIVAVGSAKSTTTRARRAARTGAAAARKVGKAPAGQRKSSDQSQDDLEPR